MKKLWIVPVCALFVAFSLSGCIDLFLGTNTTTTTTTTSTSTTTTTTTTLQGVVFQHQDNGSEHVVTLDLRSNAFSSGFFYDGGMYQFRATFDEVVTGVNSGETISIQIRLLDRIQVNRTDITNVLIYFGGLSASTWYDLTIENPSVYSMGSLALEDNTSAMRINNTTGLSGFICRLKKTFGVVYGASTLESFTYSFVVPDATPAGDFPLSYFEFNATNYSTDLRIGDVPLIFF